MKKIFVLAHAKNESDIIESFCRYNLTYCDGMLIFDNGSLDNTKEIIQNLMDEGLPIYWADDAKIKHPGMKSFKHSLSLKAFEEYDVDLVVPLDADEFLYHTDGINPREELELFNEDIEYWALWRTYLYQCEPDIELGFMPNNFSHYRNPSLERFERHMKTIVSKYLIKNKQAKFVEGAHFLEYPEEQKKSVIVKTHDKLVIAHFPIRSRMQVLKKSVNCIHKWRITARPLIDDFRKQMDSCQPGWLFNEIRNYGDITPEKIKKYSLEYAILHVINNLSIADWERTKADLGNDLEIAGPMDLSFCADKLSLRYTNYTEDFKIFLRSVFVEIDSTVMHLSSIIDEKNISQSNLLQHNNQLLQQNGDLVKQNCDLTQQKDELAQQNSELMQQNVKLSRQVTELNNQIANIYISNTWKVGKTLVKFFRVFIPHR